jgi:hypothetical protein
MWCSREITVHTLLYRVRQKYMTIWHDTSEGNCWHGEFVLECSSSETQSISFAMECWSVEHQAFAVETYSKNNDSVLTQRIFRRQFNIHWNECPQSQYFFLWGYQEQGVQKETKDNGGFQTEHQGRSGTNFFQHAATSDAELPETLGRMCWQQWMPLHRHYIQEVNVVIKKLSVKDNFSNKFE